MSDAELRTSGGDTVQGPAEFLHVYPVMDDETAAILAANLQAAGLGYTVLDKAVAVHFPGESSTEQ